MREKSIETAGRLRILLVGRKRITERKGEEIWKTRNNALEPAVEDFRGIVFRIGPGL